MNYISKFKKNQYEGKKYVEKAKASSENDEAFAYFINNFVDFLRF